MSIPTIAVVAGIIWQNGLPADFSLENVAYKSHEQKHMGAPKFLASLRLPHMPMGNFWEFPGGKIEQGESGEEALQRELLEELGIMVTDCTFWKKVEHHYPSRHVILYLFHVAAFTGQPQGLEGQTIRWLTAQEARALPFLEADIPLVAELATTLA